MAMERHVQRSLFPTGSKHGANYGVPQADTIQITDRPESTEAREPDLVVLEEGPSVPYFKIKLEMLEKWATIENLKNFTANDGARSRYENQRAVETRSVKKMKRLPGEIRKANRDLVGVDILEADGMPDTGVDIELFELSAYIALKDKYAGPGNVAARTAEIARLKNTLSKQPVELDKTP